MCLGSSLSYHSTLVKVAQLRIKEADKGMYAILPMLKRPGKIREKLIAWAAGPQKSAAWCAGSWAVTYDVM